MELARQKIVNCATDLQAWGAPQTHLDVEVIKRLQKRIEVLNLEALNEENIVEYLVTSKQLDALLLKQEVYWAQISQINWMKHGDKTQNFSTQKHLNDEDKIGSWVSKIQRGVGEGGRGYC